MPNTCCEEKKVHTKNSTQKYRSFAFTDYECDETFYAGLTNVDYLVFGEEICPTTGRTHWQGFIHYHNPRSYESIRKIFKPRHIEVAHGTPQENRAYCVKDGKIIQENGTIPKQGRRKDLEEIKDKIDTGHTDVEISNDYFSTWLQWHRALDRYRDLKEPRRNWKTKVTWIWGPTGTGKTYKAINNGATPISIVNGFVIGYKGEDIVVFDDFDTQTISRAAWLTLTDRYPCTINVKGAERNWKPREIYVTSNFDPDFIFPNDAACKRRIDEIIHLTEPFTPPEIEPLSDSDMSEGIKEKPQKKRKIDE